MIEYLEASMDAQLAVHDAMALAKMRAVSSMDDIEKIMEANGPIIEDLSRTMEPPMRDLGVMLKYNIIQWMTTGRIMQYVGPDGISKEVFDYNPDSLVPSHAPGENSSDPSLYSARERARIFADNLRFFILPNTLHEYAQMYMKLGLVQLRKAGISIDSQTIAEAWNIPNYGIIPGNTVLEKFQAEKEQELVQAARLQTIAQAEGLMPPGGGRAAGSTSAGSTEGRRRRTGRPSTHGAEAANLAIQRWGRAQHHC
jgi:hypothetical protein